MSFSYRALLNIWQRKGRTLLFLGLFLIVFSLILSGFAIQKSAEKGKIDARKQIGAEVKLKRDNKKMSEAVQQGIFEFPTPSQETADAIAELPEVKTVQLEGQTGAVENGLKYVEPKKTEEFGGNLLEGPIDESKRPKFNIIGTNNSAGSKDFKNRDAKLMKGEGITQQSPENAAVIEETFAENNKLDVGDSFKLKGSSIEDKGQEREVNVVGIYKSDKIPAGYEQGVVISQPENQLFVNFKVFTELSDQASLGEVSFQLKDPLQVDAFTKKAEKMLTEDEKYYKLDANTEQYKQMVGPIEKMAAFSSIMIKVILLAGGIILALLILLSVRERKSEIGILLSLGEEKIKISLQLITEMLLIAVVSFGLASAVISALGEPISNSILANQIESAEKEETVTNDMFEEEAIEEAAPISSMEIKLDQTILIQASSMGLLLVIITTMIPSVMIARMDPKDLFSQKE